MEKIKAFLNYDFSIGEDIHFTVRALIITSIVLLITSFVLKTTKKLINRQLDEDGRGKFKVFFGYIKWLVYIVIMLVTFDNFGVNVNAIFAASAALLIGIGLALQTLFQDIISGIFILIDQTVHVGDIIELDGKIGRVEEIKLRTTRAVTIENKVMIIPNHLYLTHTLYNWTQNEKATRESINIGVAYGSDVEKVKEILLQAASSHPKVLKHPAPYVLFENFGESSLDFRLIITLNDSFKAIFYKSDIRFDIDKLFRENNISIPFPQRDIHIKNN